MSLTETIRAWLLEPALTMIEKMEKKIMSQLDDLNTAIQAEDVQIQAIAPVVRKISADLDALAAALKAGGSSVDLTAQVQAIQSHTAAIVTAIQQLSDSDTKDAPPTAA